MSDRYYEELIIRMETNLEEHKNELVIKIEKLRELIQDKSILLKVDDILKLVKEFDIYYK